MELYWGKRRTLVVPFILLIGIYQARANIHGACDSPLGMASGDIDDASITASSSYAADHTGPHRARLGQDKKGGAWCPKSQVDSHSNEFLQIDLGVLFAVTTISSQGRFGNQKGKEYSPFYRVQYQTKESGPWVQWKNFNGSQLLRGTESESQTHVIVNNTLSPRIVARRIRIFPSSPIRRTVCLRVELRGCPWLGPVSYSVPQGDMRAQNIDLRDLQYSGDETSAGHLIGGLGQLTDGIEAKSSFRVDNHNIHIRGYDFVGWKSNGEAPLEIDFHFSSPRNFTALTFEINNQISQNVGVFKAAKAWFSSGGKYFQKDPVSFVLDPDNYLYHDESASASETITLDRRVGKAVRLQLWFNKKWMLFSEFNFHSDAATVEGADVLAKLEKENTELPTKYPPGEDFPRVIPQFVEQPGKFEFARENEETGTEGYSSETNIEDNESSFEPKEESDPESTTSESTRGLTGKDVKVIIGALATLVAAIFICTIIAIVYYYRRKNGKKGSDSPVNHPLFQDMEGLQHAKKIAPFDHVHQYSAVPRVQTESDDDERVKMPRVLTNPCLTHSSSHSGSEHSTDKPLLVMLPSPPSSPGPTHQYETIPAHRSGLYYASTDVTTPSDHGENYVAIDKLKIVNTLGEGAFGQLHVCQVPERENFVIVRSLNPSADLQTREEFRQEVAILAHFDHPNITKLLQVDYPAEPRCIVLQYTPEGDLCHFLRDSALDVQPDHNKTRCLCYGDLLHISSQIALALRYIESLGSMHHDIAARNCLIGRDLSVKVTNVAKWRDDFSTDYCFVDGRNGLPLRWMAVESIIKGEYSTKSDVWAFAVALWEILTLASHKPYHEATDAQIIEQANVVVCGSGSPLKLPLPANCPREMWDLMQECWQIKPEDRPSFAEIHMFLMRKNMGYSKP